MLPSRLQFLERIQSRADTLTPEIHAAASTATNEWEFRRKFANLIEELAKEFNIPLTISEEHTLATGRMDAAYNRMIIEYKMPGTLRASLGNRQTNEAMQQLREYMTAVAKEEKLQLARLYGVVVDGNFFIFVRYADQKWQPEDPLPVNTHTVARFLKLLFSLVSGKALTPQNLDNDFGSRNDTAPQFAQALYAVLANDPPPLVQALFKQWTTFFGEVTGYEEGSARLRDKPELKKFAQQMGIDPGRVDPPRLFFAVHTYFALLIKFIAWLALSRFVSPFGGVNLLTLSGLESAQLRSRLREMERGGIFRSLRIRNFLEADFFGWYLSTWTPEIEQAIRTLVEQLADYDPGTLEVSPEQTRDLLKKLYHTLMPRELRHDLGEYYTPDWLAQRVLDIAESGSIRGDYRKKFLDPACGSGTFLVLAIQRVKEYCRQQGFHERDTLKAILANVAGIDLNPLAVIAARTNYVLALGDLLAHNQEDIDLPVYLADSIVMPSEGQGLFGHDHYPIKTTVGTFIVPSSLKNREQIETLANLLEECIESEVSVTAFLARLQKNLSLSAGQWQASQSLLAALYQDLQKHHATDQNGIWARIIKNAFMPLFLKDFDYIVGNPPWVNWESLPEEYRQESKKLWVKHGLFPHGGMDTILGKGKKDISMLMTYEAMDSYLKDGGRLAFVITQSVFKTAGAGQGFRRFRLGSGTPIRPVTVDDFSSFQCFEGATNRTAVVVLQKGRPVKYPVTYTYWQKTRTGKAVGYDADLEEVKAMTRRIVMQAAPVQADDPTSPWLTARPKALKAIKKVLGPSDYTAHAGVYSGGANGVFWLEILERRADGLLLVRNITEGAKREVEQVTALLEPDLIYPLLRGRDVQRWRATPSAHILMVQDPKTRRGLDEETMQLQYPRTWAYLKQFESVLRARKSQSVRRLMEKGPFYSMFAVGDYTFSPFKVVWTRVGTQIQAAVLGRIDGKVSFPIETATMVAFDYEDEAHYFCAMLNSGPGRFVAQSYAVHGTGSFGSPHILTNTRIMTFSRENPIFIELSKKSLDAHLMKIRNDKKALLELERRIDHLAAQLWGITADELKEIRWNLADLQAGGREAKQKSLINDI